jgi:hypothetical protein
MNNQIIINIDYNLIENHFVAMAFGFFGFDIVICGKILPISVGVTE